MKVERFTKPVVASLCGTFLKPEMQSVYRQITGLRRHRTVVLTERHIHPEKFDFEPVVVMEKPLRPRWIKPPRFRRGKKGRPRGNFVRRFYYKYVLGVWPPPEKPAPPEPPPPTVPTRPVFYEEPYNLVDLLRRHDARLAHVYYGHKAAKYLPMLQRWGGPVIVSFHGMDVTDGAYKSTDPATLQEVFAHARLVLARSESLLARLREMGCPTEKLRLNHTAIPMEHLPRAVRRLPEDGAWIFLQACRLIAKKGITTTLRAMREVVDAWPRARFVLAGDGPQMDAIRTLTAELDLIPNVELVGWRSQEQLLALYQRAHVFLHPSELTTAGDQEGIPNSLLEAMATGLPVVATLHGGIPEAVVHGEDGLLVPEKSPSHLAAAILSLTRDPALLEALSLQAAENVKEKFGAARQLQILEDCYAEAISLGQAATSRRS